MKHVILGTAGHIDHGKSALVKALTGIDPDRLKEEKERGITIDIGFADLSYPDSGISVGIVDVPGHEKLISNMLAGAGGIDMVLMVIAADEGIMPQSREHLYICNLLNIKSGIIAVTKSDLVEKEWIDLVIEEIKGFVKGTFLENAPILAVSSRTGENIDALKTAIREMAAQIIPKKTGGLFRMPVDRVFTLKGFGTVITGTAISGSVSVDDTLEILPAGIMTKVRGLHTHGKAITTAYAGQRVAINIQGVEKEELRRGDVAVLPGTYQPTKTIDAYLELLGESPTIKTRSLVHFYSGTSDTVARLILYGKDELKPSETCFCQLRLNDPVVVVSGDRYIIRRFSPLETLGGGTVLDPNPLRRKIKDGVSDLEIFYKEGLEQKILQKIKKAGIFGIKQNVLNSWINAEVQEIDSCVKRLIESGDIIHREGVLIHCAAADLLRRKIGQILEDFHSKNPLKPGMQKEEIRTVFQMDPRLFNALVNSFREFVVEKDLIRLKDFKIALTDSEESYRSRIVKMLEEAGFQPPSKQEIMEKLGISQKQVTDMLNILSKEGSIVRINETVYLARSYYEKMLAVLKSHFSKKTEITVAEFRDMIGTSRKFALPFLEYLDTKRITIRTGDVRKFLMKN